MSIVRWEPLSELNRIRQDMDRIFSEVFGTTMLAPPTSDRWIPLVDVFQTDNEVVVKAELPGVNRKDLEVTTTDESVVIKGESKTTEEEKKQDYYRKEMRYGSFQRMIPLPVKVKSQAAKASFKDGILEIHLPVLEEEQAKERKIPIE